MLIPAGKAATKAIGLGHFTPLESVVIRFSRRLRFSRQARYERCFCRDHG
jgi:hypothetical protein